MAVAICATKVDLPIPGSPLNKMSEPGTTPPPKTRSISKIFVLNRVNDVAFISFKSMMVAPPIFLIISLRASLSSCSCSPKVPQEPHSKQRPLHFGNWASQFAQL